MRPPPFTISDSTGSASFAYDALGRRITKTLNSQTTSVLYDGLDAVRESRPGGEVAYLRTLAIDEALSRTEGTETLTYLADILGSTLAVADSTGALPTTYTYAPFGDTAATGSPSANPFQFTGRENDGTGLYYYRARYYDPVRSRFVSEDPIRFTGGINFYRYVGNHPQNKRDPRGLQEQWPGDPLPGLVDPADEWRELMNAIARGYSRMGRTVCEQLCEYYSKKACPRLEGPVSSTLCEVLCGQAFDSLEQYSENLERQRRHERFLQEHGQ